MESRCYGCAVKFTFFKKENGCKNCGRAYCSGCLSFSAVVPRAGNSQQKVCKQCHEVLTRGSSPANASKWSPPQNYKKRVAALEAKQKPSTPQRQGLTKQDQLIAERLARLRQEKKPKSVPSQAEIEARLAALKDEPQGSIPSTQEMEARLAALQGRVPPARTPQPVHQTPDTRTQAQQAQDLLTQLTAEVAIDERWERGGQGTSIQNDLNQGQSTDSKGQATCSLDGEKSRLLAEAAAKLQEENTRQERILALAKRLAVLQGRDPDRVTLQDYHLPDSDDSEDEEKAIQRVLQQLTEEAALDEASGFNIPAEPTLQAQAKACRAEPEAQATAPRPAAEEEELPWCCICNEDATLRCAGCDGDLYCVRCFREGHDAFELKEHQTSAYHPPHAGQVH
ncbi:abscission/NoCut checkpoint regulator [Artibeus jamaicensis]|uniref:abscission/NoCut checkpoint regulator n=1 Tax=Artibeus jamaicensis TaxID=9417 RepID=UPI00235A5039|nr:abscission/NoCut checkpoint regulator [Artibeus jamaicensis]